MKLNIFARLGAQIAGGGGGVPLRGRHNPLADITGNEWFVSCHTSTVNHHTSHMCTGILTSDDYKEKF